MTDHVAPKTFRVARLADANRRRYEVAVSTMDEALASHGRRLADAFGDQQSQLGADSATR